MATTDKPRRTWAEKNPEGGKWKQGTGVGQWEKRNNQTQKTLDRMQGGLMGGTLMSPYMSGILSGPGVSGGGSPELLDYLQQNPQLANQVISWVKQNRPGSPAAQQRLTDYATNYQNAFGFAPSETHMNAVGSPASLTLAQGALFNQFPQLKAIYGQAAAPMAAASMRGAEGTSVAPGQVQTSPINPTQPSPSLPGPGGRPVMSEVGAPRPPRRPIPRPTTAPGALKRGVRRGIVRDRRMPYSGIGPGGATLHGR